VVPASALPFPRLLSASPARHPFPTDKMSEVSTDPPVLEIFSDYV